MSYTVKTRVYQTNTNAFFHLVEEAVYTGGTWSEHDGIHSLTMRSSGTSGMLRFTNEQASEAFHIVLGVHNYKPWLDIVGGIANDISCVKALPEYYGGGSRSGVALVTHQSIKADNRTISANFRVAEGHNLELDIVIG